MVSHRATAHLDHMDGVRRGGRKRKAQTKAQQESESRDHSHPLAPDLSGHGLWQHLCNYEASSLLCGLSS